MEFEALNKQGQWVPLREDEVDPDKWAELKASGKLRQINQAPAEPLNIFAERNRVLAEENNNYNAFDLLPDNIGIPATKIGRVAASMLTPVSAAYAEQKALNGEERAVLPSIGAAAADVGLSLLMPIRLGMAGLKAAGVTMPKFATGRLASSTGNKVAQAGIGAVDNVANSVLTTGAENVAGDNHNELDAWNIIPTAGVGAFTGARKINKMEKARGELVSSVPKDIRLNERAERIAESDLGMGSTKNKNSINLAGDLFKNPNLSLNEAISRTAGNEANITRPDVSKFNQAATLPAKFEPPARPDTHTETSQALNASREWILNDLMAKGYINSDGVPLRKLDAVDDYLDNMINWNKNQQGQARAAVDEKAARELSAELRQGIRDGKISELDWKPVEQPKGKRKKKASLEDLELVSTIKDSDELKALDKFKNEWSENLTKKDVLAGMADKRAVKDAKTSGDYYPMRDINPVDLRNVNLYKDQAPNLASARVQEDDFKQTKKPQSTDPVINQYEYLLQKHGKDYGPATEFYKTLTKQQKIEAMARMLGEE